MRNLKALSVLLAMIIVVSSVALVFAGSNVQLKWDQNNEPDMKEYRVYRSNTPNIVPASKLLVGKVLHPTHSFVDSDVPDGTWYWIVTAVDTEGNESAPSNEVSTALDTTPPAPPQNYIIQIVMKIVMWLKFLIFGV